MTTKKKYYGIESLEKNWGPMSLGLFLRGSRENDDISQANLARKLKISRANLCDIEKGRKLVAPDRAAKFAHILGFPEAFFISLSLQDELRAANLNYSVDLKSIKPSK